MSMRWSVLHDDQMWARWRDRMFVAVAAFAIFTMLVTSVVVIRTNETVNEVNENQIMFVQAQNNAQICTQHDIVVAVKQIGRKLGLPVDDISVPDIGDLVCP